VDHKTGCIVCGGELVYAAAEREVRCHYCGTASRSSVSCARGHFVCDGCHSGSANDLIERYCAASESRAPLSMAVTLMKDQRVKMHGPEHHFLVPAVLLAAYCNATGRQGEKAGMLAAARRRAGDIKGGFCGTHGACGAALGTGIFVSVASGATPLSRSEWRLANLMSSESLRVIADQGGPRCCKRDSFLAIRAAGAFLQRELAVSLPPEDPVVCEFSELNGECLREECPFFAG
jgi:hypothetical protein